MIGRAIKGRGFRGVLNYLAGKHDSFLLGGNMVGRSPRELAREFGVQRRLRPDRQLAVLHLPLRPAPGETLSREQWRSVAERVLTHLGYTDTPYVLYLHRDTEEHLHIVASIIRFDGSVVSTFNDYYRVMEVLRDVERDLGLRVVPHQESGNSPAREEAYKLLERTGEPSVREALQCAVREAAGDRPTVTAFLERLQGRGIEVIPNVASTGRVTGISYRSEGYTFKGSTLGAAFSWRGVRERLGVAYDAERDLPALLAAQARAAGTAPAAASSAPAAPPEASGRPARLPAVAVPRASLPSAPAAGAAGSRASLPSPSTAGAARAGDPIRSASTAAAAGAPHPEALRHLAALGSPRCQVLVLDRARGRRQLLAGLTPEQLAAALPALRAASEAGAEILLRPSHHAHLTVLVGVRPEVLARALYRPDLAVRVGDTYELWFRHGHALTREERAVLGPLLARAFEVPADRATADYAHLAGFEATPVTFSGPPPARERAAIEDSGRTGAAASSIERLESAAAELLAGLRGERETQAALAELAELERTTGPLLPSLSQLHERARTAEERFAEIVAPREGGRVPPPWGRTGEGMGSTAARDLGQARAALAEQAGRPDLGALSRADLDTHVSLRGRLAAAERRVEDAELQALARPSPAADSRLAAADLGRRSLLEELTSFETVRGLPPSREAQPGFLGEPPPPPPERPAVPPGTPATVALELEAAQLRLHLAQLGAAHDHLASRLPPVERLLATDPRPAVSARFADLLERLDTVDRAVAAAGRALSEVERELRESRLGDLGEAVLAEPTPARLGAYLRAATEDVAPAPSHRAAQPEARAAVVEIGRFFAEPTAEQLARVRELAVGHRAHALAAREAPLYRDLAGARAARRSAERAVLAAERPGAALLQRWSAAHDRESALLARRFARSAPSPGGDLRDLLLRVRAGDRSVSTLADLARGAAREILAAGRPLPRPPGAPAGIAPREIVRVERAHAAAFLREARALLRDGVPREPGRLAVLHDRLTAYQAVREQRAAFQGRLPTSVPISPPHGASRDRSGRAAGAWAARAAALGLPPEQIGAALGRHLQRSRYGLPRSASPAGLDTVARLAHWGAAAARRQVSPRSVFHHLERLAGAPLTPERFLLRVGLAAYSMTARALGLAR